MKFVDPSYVIMSRIQGTDMIKFIEECGRTCYKSEDSITPDSAQEFVSMLIKKGHESVLEHEKITVRFVCDRGVSHELVRHRIASFSQESTRYCNYFKDKFGKELTFIRPCFWSKSPENDLHNENHVDLEALCLESEKIYNRMINRGAKPQEARYVLPNGLKTEIVVTANLREWREIFRQRTARAAHPQMRELMRPLLDDLKNHIPVVFDDINY